MLVQISKYLKICCQRCKSVYLLLTQPDIWQVTRGICWLILRWEFWRHGAGRESRTIRLFWDDFDSPITEFSGSWCPPVCALQSPCIASRLRKVMIPLFLEHSVQVWVPQYKGKTDKLDQVQWRAQDIWAKATALEFDQPGKEDVQGNATAVFYCLRGGYREDSQSRPW